jgi:integrase
VDNSVVQETLSQLKGAEKRERSERLFPFEKRYLGRVFKRAVEAAKVAPFRFHDLRHTFASRLAMNGANDRTIMALGGWKSPRMLDRYAHLSPAHCWQAVEGLVKSGAKSGTEVVGVS